jgi:coproporphyrinogen III oxidase-like Fe-S oxidoreductase
MEKKLTFTLSEKEANLIISGLGELPAKLSMDLIIKLQTQATPQLKQEQPDAKE